MKVTISDGKNTREHNFREGLSAGEAIEALGFDFPMPCGGMGRCGKCLCEINGREVKACETLLFADSFIRLPERKETVLTAQCDVEDVTGAVIDIGTTTVAAALFKDGKPVKTFGARNPQCVYGADVISRIGAGDTKALTKSINERVDEIRRYFGENQPFVITGNTAMLSLFVGLDVKKMGVYPFELPSKFDFEQDGAYFPPCAGAFVGADALCSVLRSGAAEKDEAAMVLDLGTNAEIALVHRGEITLASAAAGPALEGAGISCGMSAAEGAVCHVSSKGVEVIGGGTAKGICAGGLIDAVALMLENGAIDSFGTLPCPYELCPEVHLLQEDIRAFQLCKGAVRAGIKRLLAKAGLRKEDLKRIYLSGALGENLIVENAILTGLLPELPVESFTSIGNGALLGGAMLLKNENREKIRAMAARAKVINFAEDSEFVGLYINEMNFEK